MRRILVDHARRDGRAKRGGGVPHLVLDDVDPPSALGAGGRGRRLRAGPGAHPPGGIDPNQGRIVELRYFGGLAIEEAALVMGVSPATVKREWAVARAWLFRELTGGSAPPA